MYDVNIWVVLILIVAFLFVRSIYRLFAHPLHNFPGPKLAAITNLYEFYYSVIEGGTYIWKIEKMHEKYGNRRLNLFIT
jgi:hypothetical protein